MELLDKLKEETDLLLSQIALIKDEARIDEIIKSFLVNINSLKNSVNETLNLEKELDIDLFTLKDDGIHKIPSKKREFTENEKQILNQYLKSIREVKENTEEENKELYTLMHSNNIIERTKAREDLIKGNMKLALRFLSRIVLNYKEVTNLEDLINEVNVDLVRSVNYYNPELGPFKNLLFFTIKRSVGECLEVGSRNMELPKELKKKANEISTSLSDTSKGYEGLKDALFSINLDDEIDYLSDEIDEFHTTNPSLIEPSFEDLILADKDELRNSINNMLKILEPRELEIIKQRFGIGCDKMTIEDLAKLYNTSKERIRMVEARALFKLRQPLRKRKMRSI